MNPHVENLITSFLTGIGVGATTVLGFAPSTERDMGVILATALVSFCGSFVTGLRQLHKEIP
jgi:hypothetical protein